MSEIVGFHIRLLSSLFKVRQKGGYMNQDIVTLTNLIHIRIIYKHNSQKVETWNLRIPKTRNCRIIQIPDIFKNNSYFSNLTEIEDKCTRLELFEILFQ